MGFLKSAKFLEVILNHVTLGGPMEGHSRPSWCIKEKKKSGKMVPRVLLATEAYGLSRSSSCKPSSHLRVQLRPAHKHPHSQTNSK